eukprot:6848340-Pyramimonas_sp.AAC.1
MQRRRAAAPASRRCLRGENRNVRSGGSGVDLVVSPGCEAHLTRPATKISEAGSLRLQLEEASPPEGRL